MGLHVCLRVVFPLGFRLLASVPGCIDNGADASAPHTKGHLAIHTSVQS